MLAGLNPADMRGARLPRTVERLRAGWSSVVVSLAIDLVAGRAAARQKFGPDHPRWYTPTSLQQASGAAAAAHRAARLAPFGHVLELAAGIGGDTLALARAGASVVAYESNPLLAAMLRRNLAAAGLAGRVEIHVAPAEDAALDGFDAVYADPSRRSGARRSTSLKSLSPPTEFLTRLAARAPAAVIKLAPATSLPALQAAFPGAEIEFVSVAGELKEAVIWAGSGALVPLRATLLPSGADLTGEPGHYLPVEPAGRFIAEPDPALVRSGLFTEFARATGVAHTLLAPQIAFLTCATVPSTPFARYFRVIDSLPFSDRAIVKRLRELDCGPLTVRCRGFPEPGDIVARRLQKRLHGDTPLRLFIYRTGDRHHAVVAEFQPTVGSSSSDLAGAKSTKNQPVVGE